MAAMSFPVSRILVDSLGGVLNITHHLEVWKIVVDFLDTAPPGKQKDFRFYYEIK